MQRLNNKRRWIATQPAVARNDGQEKEKGFTLVELVITIAIVIILSVISVPIYRGYIDKAKYSEGYALLGVVLSAQKAYYSEYGNFLRQADSAGHNGWTYCDPSLGIDVRGNKYFTMFYSGASNDIKEGFWIHVKKPEELKNENDRITLQYHITSGSTVYEAPH